MDLSEYSFHKGTLRLLPSDVHPSKLAVTIQQRLVAVPDGVDDTLQPPHRRQIGHPLVPV